MDSSRTKIIVGEKGLNKLSNTRVAIFGLGGVGGYALEGIVRAGIGKIFLVDYDCIEQSNFNRQILALNSTLGKPKVDVASERVYDVNPDIEIYTIQKQITPDNVSSIFPDNIDYAIDAIDELDAKVHLIRELHDLKIPFVSSMGAGNKLNPAGIKVNDISQTAYCPLARAVRRRLKQLGITQGIRCIYSEENLNSVFESEKGHNSDDNPEPGGKVIPGSISYIPAIFGLTAAGIIINDILNNST